MTVQETIRAAETLLPGRAAPEGQRDPRWQAIIAVGEFIEDNPEAVWPFVARWGASSDADLRAAIATCLLEHLLEHHFDAFISRVEQAARADVSFREMAASCWGFGDADHPDRAARFQRAVQTYADESQVAARVDTARFSPPPAVGGDFHQQTTAEHDAGGVEDTMTGVNMTTETTIKTPWHLWLVGVVAVLFNAIGAFDHVMSMTRGASYMASAGMTPAQIAHYEAMPAWMLAVWTIGVWGAMLGSALILLRNKLAVAVFAVSLAAFLLSLIYTYVLTNGGEIMGAPMAVVSGVIAALLLCFMWYSSVMTKRGVLR